MADRPARARLQDHRRLPQGQRAGDPRDLPPVRAAVPRARPVLGGRRSRSTAASSRRSTTATRTSRPTSCRSGWSRSRPASRATWRRWRRPTGSEDEVLKAKSDAPEGEDRLPPRAGAALPRHGACGAGRAGPADLADRPGCALHGDERQGHRDRRLQRAGGRGHEAPPDRRARGDERRQRPRPALGDGRAGPRGDGPGGADGHRRPRLLRRRGDPRLRSGPA